LPKKEIELLERYFFPDAGMGWLEDIQYDLSNSQNAEFEELLKQLYEAWKE